MSQVQPMMIDHQEDKQVGNAMPEEAKAPEILHKAAPESAAKKLATSSKRSNKDVVAEAVE